MLSLLTEWRFSENLTMGYISPHIVWTQKLGGHELKNGEIWLGQISQKSINAITNRHAWILLECYVDPQALRQIANDDGVSPGEILEKQFLPDVVRVKRGNFGEILAMCVIQEKHNGSCFPVLHWRYRKKNEVVQGIDLLGYVAEKNPEDDRLILGEVKTRTYRDPSSVESAYKDARKHVITALSNELYMLKKILLQEGRDDESKNISRFSHPHHRPYILHLLPCVVCDSRVWNEEFLERLPENHCSDEYKNTEFAELIVVTLENLAHWIDEVHQSAIEQAGK